jgi:hypothetical protein
MANAFRLAHCRRRKADAGTPGFGKADGDGLPRRADPVIAFPNMVYLLAHKFPGLGGRGFSEATIPVGACSGARFGHTLIF